MHVLVHGGAGSEPSEPDRRQTVLEAAARAGAENASPVTAVENAVNELESAPRFNAGVGSAVQADGVVRTDAGIMTSDRTVGAVCSMPNVEHAVSVARIVVEETPHVFVSGAHAVALADAYSVETDVDCWSERTRERWDGATPPDGFRDRLEWVREEFGGSGTSPDGVNPGRRPDHDHDTVGAVAFDGDALAAATSTGVGGSRFPDESATSRRSDRGSSVLPPRPSVPQAREKTSLESLSHNG